MQSYVCFNNHQEIVDFIEKYKQETIQKNYVKGPETVSIKNLKNNDDLYLLSELPLSHVHTISFKDCSFDKPSQNKLFKRHGFFMNVRHWEFLSCEITKEILKTFFINKATKSVESIVVEPRGDGVEMFKTLTKWKKLQNVTRFAFIGSRIGKEELDGFSQAPIFQRLEHLDLSHTKFYDDGLTDFITKFNNKNIRGIYLQSTGISDATAKIILTNKSFSNLEVLDLSNNFSMDCVVTGLSESKRMNHIQELYLRNTQLSMGPLDELFSSHNFSSFKRLDVSNNYNLRDDLSLSLLAKPFIRKLEHLNLENTGLTNLSLFALILNSESGHLKNLKSLDISNNPEVHVAEAFNTITSNTHLICDEVFKAKSLSEDLKYKAESEFKIRESPFIRSLHTLHMANLSLSPDLKANLEKRYQVSVELEPVVFKDYSDYMEHINVTLYDLQDQETASPKA